MSETTTPLKEHHWIGLVAGIIVCGVLMAASQETDESWIRGTIMAVALLVLLFSIRFFHHGRKVK